MTESDGENVLRLWPHQTVMNYCETHEKGDASWLAPHCCECLRYTLACRQQETNNLLAEIAKLRGMVEEMRAAALHAKGRINCSHVPGQKCQIDNALDISSSGSAQAEKERVWKDLLEAAKEHRDFWSPRLSSAIVAVEAQNK